MDTDHLTCALWISALLAAVDPTVDPLPATLDEFVTTCVALIRARARA